MARPRTYKTQGVVLKQIPIGEADRVLTFCTPEMGKLRAVARGVRRTKSRLGGHLELLTHVSVSVARGRALDTVTEATTIHSFRAIREDLRRLSEAVYMAELVDGFSAEQSPSASVFELLLSALGWLQEGQSTAQLMRYFEVQLLVRSGFGPELYQCVECRSMLEPGDYLYSCAKGGILCPRCRSLSGEAMLSLSLNAIKVLSFFHRESFDRVEALKVSAAILGEVERLLRTNIRYVLERELKSTEFMDLVASASVR